MRKHLILIGFMGTGKTTIGKLLAKKWKLDHVDTDHLIELDQQCSIPDFFQAYGEEHFRKEETKALTQSLQNFSPTVITTGGGIVLREENRAQIRQNGWVFALDAHPDEIIRRLQSDTTRPLLRGGSLKDRVYHLYKQRKPLYQFADFTIDTSEISTSQVVSEISDIWFNLTKKR